MIVVDESPGRSRCHLRRSRDWRAEGYTVRAGGSPDRLEVTAEVEVTIVDDLRSHLRTEVIVVGDLVVRLGRGRWRGSGRAAWEVRSSVARRGDLGSLRSLLDHIKVVVACDDGWGGSAVVDVEVAVESVIVVVS